MRALPTVALTIAIVLHTTALSAQTASPYVPLDHWAMPFVEHLIRAGIIADPTPLTRPLKQRDVLSALDAADTARLSASMRATIRRIAAEWQPQMAQPHFRAELGAGAAAATYAVRDPLSLDRGLMPARLDEHAFGNTDVDVQLLFGPVVAVSHLVLDSRLPFDPEWYATTNTATRFAEAYVNGQWRVVEVFFGILDRNWGPSAVPSLVLSANPYSMDHFALTLGTSGVRLQTFATQLDTRATSSGDAINRYMVVNRLWIRPHGRWTLALWEGGVIQGVGRQLEPWFLNPASIVYFRESSGDMNAMLGVDFERRAGTTVFGQVFLDDIQVTRHNESNLEPASYGLTVGAQGMIRTRALTWTAYYTQVANLTYRTPIAAESPLYFNLGTGRNFADYDQVTVKLSALVHPALLVEPEATLLRQGQGDPRLPYPMVADYPTTPVLFQGVVQRVVQLLLGARWQHAALSVTGSGGAHFVSNLDHVSGASKTEWIGSVGVTFRFHQTGRLP